MTPENVVELIANMKLIEDQISAAKESVETARKSADQQIKTLAEQLVPLEEKYEQWKKTLNA